jgi:hypothetical protein
LVYSWFSSKENHTSRSLSGHSNCETALERGTTENENEVIQGSFFAVKRETAVERPAVSFLLPIKKRANDSADDSSLGSLSGRRGHVLHQLVSQLGDR